MATASLPETASREDRGRLANNFILVQMCQTALSRSEMNVSTVPKLIRRLIDEEAWREWIDTSTGQYHSWNAPDFRLFLESPRPDGCATPIRTVRQMLEGHDDIVKRFEKLIRSEPGGDRPDQPRSDDGSFVRRNRNNVPVAPDQETLMVIEPPASISLPDPEPPKRKRDYARESKQGNTVSYAIRRLSKEAEGGNAQAAELLDLVLRGEMKPHRAMVEGGFKIKPIEVPDDPIAAGRRLLRHFKGDRLAALIDILRAALDTQEVPRDE